MLLLLDAIGIDQLLVRLDRLQGVMAPSCFQIRNLIVRLTFSGVVKFGDILLKGYFKEIIQKFI